MPEADIAANPRRPVATAMVGRMVFRCTPEV
jgi:hypothetical protein